MESVDGRVCVLICVTTDACSALDNFDSENEGINKSFRTHEDRKSECMRGRESASSPPCLAASIHADRKIVL